MFSKFFIDRPVFATVLSIMIVMAGLVSIKKLPVSQYPDIIPPEVSVSAFYPGANAEVLAATVAAPIEDQINGVPNMLYMRSTNSNSGQMSLSVTFAVGTDPDQATIDVNNRVAAAQARLPQEVRAQGVNVTKRSSSILQVVAMYSEDGRYDPIFLSNFTLLNVLDDIKRLNGVGDASLFSAKNYAIRIWLKPDKLAQLGLSPLDVETAVLEQNSQFAAGQFGQAPLDQVPAFTYALTTQNRFTTPEQFEEIILRSNEKGATLRLKDVARVELGAQDYSLSSSLNGKPAVVFGIYLQPGANALAVAKSVQEKMQELSARFPDSVKFEIPFDTTKFVRVSIHKVIETFIEAILLVVAVVFLFLQRARATFIPVIVVPVALIGTFAGMYLLGFSINLLTLFGLVLAIGIVVDDAIVVIENVERIMREEKKSARSATIQAMDEVTGPIVAIVLVLCSVFIPVGFLGGLTGVMYQQFAITIAVSVVISGFVALTLTPALCVILLKNEEQPLKPMQAFNRLFARLTDTYVQGVQGVLKHRILAIFAFCTLVAIATLFYMRLPATLVPDEDQGYLVAVYNLMPGASLGRTSAVTQEMTHQILQQKEVDGVITLAGFDILSTSQKTSAGVSFIPLKDWSERQASESSSQSLAGRLFGLGLSVKEAVTFAFNPPPITGISITGGFEGYIQNRSGLDYPHIAEAVNKVVEAANKRPELAGVRTTLSTSVPQYYIDLDREKAHLLNVPVDLFFATMQATFGSYYINDFTYSGRVFRVYMQSEGDFRSQAEDLKQVFVRSTTGNMISLDALVTLKRIVGPDVVERYNGWPSAKIMGQPAPGYSSGQALQAMQEVVHQELPGLDWMLAWTGAAYQEEESQGTAITAMLMGLLMVFLILAALYERWTLPLAVLLTVPFAIFGAVISIGMCGLFNDVYFQVGILTLMGLSAKNAILIVEFAMLRRQQGESMMDAAIHAARLRFRPIIMTSLAFILGCLPLALSSGAGAASRHSIGIGVIGGMLSATFIAVFFIPLFFCWMAGFDRKKTVDFHEDLPSNDESKDEKDPHV